MSGIGLLDLKLYLPVLLLAGWGLLLLLVGLCMRREGGPVLACVALLGVAADGAALLWLWRSGVLWGRGQYGALGGSAFVDPLGVFLCILVLASLALVLLMGPGLMGEQHRGHGILCGEYHSLVLLAGAGVMALVLCTNLVVLFLALETFSICVYVLAGIDRQEVRSSEAALKYFVLGAFSSAFLLYGIALYYGATGSFDLSAAAAAGESTLLAAGLCFLAVGMAFKVGAVPFHWWVPDVYEGAPTAVTGLMASAIKIGGFAFLLRVLLGAGAAWVWMPLIWTVAAATMLYGALVALWQESFKRLLAYSSIAHTGYLLIGFVVAGRDPRLGAGAIVFYLAAYTFMTAGAFACLASLQRRGEELERIEDYRGLAYRRPFTAFALAVFLVSLAGLPPTGGFVAKFYLFKGAIDVGLYGLAGIGILTSGVALYYYLRVIVLCYMHEPVETFTEEFDAWGVRWAIGLSLAGVALLGLFPGQVHGALLRAASRVVPGW